QWPRRGGLRVEIGGDLPVGAGLSSSAALRVAVLRGLARLAGKRISLVQISELAQRVENEFLGVPVGPLYPLSCAAAPRGWRFRLDFGGKPQIRRVRMPRHWAILIFATQATR